MDEDALDLRRPSSEVLAFDLNISTSWSVAAVPDEQHEPLIEGAGECFDMRSVFG